MHKVINSINNAFRYKKNCFRIKKNLKTILFLKCLVKSNVIRYFKEIKSVKGNSKEIIGYVNTSMNLQIKTISKGGRKIYLSNQKQKNEVNSFLILTNSKDKCYINSKDKNKIMGELTAKIFI